MKNKLNIILKNGEEIKLQKEHITYNVSNESLRFIIDNMDHILDIKNETLKRENNEYSFFLDILNKKCELILKKENYILQVHVEYAILLKNKNKVEISYLIETDDQETKIMIELEE